MTTERDADDLEADLNHQLGNTGTIIRESTDHVPAPSGHAPRLETVVGRDWEGICVSEARCPMDEGAWLMARNPMQVER